MERQKYLCTSAANKKKRWQQSAEGGAALESVLQCSRLMKMSKHTSRLQCCVAYVVILSSLVSQLKCGFVSGLPSYRVTYSSWHFILWTKIYGMCMDV